MDISGVFSIFRDDLRRAEEWMERSLESEVSLIPEIGRHLIGGGGKRFRPLLLLASARLCGYEGEKRYPFCAVIEFIHTATLLHDDVIDEAQTRRGKTSANHIWGNAASVLVGDYLYSKAFQLMKDYGDMRIIGILAETTNAMAEGEVFQLMKCGDPKLTEEDYLAIIDRKTARLMRAAASIGACLAEVPPYLIDAVSEFGLHIGYAFQIVDDTLDYTAKEDTFGKAVGKDLQEGKITLPLIRTLAMCRDEERAFVSSQIMNRFKEVPDEKAIMALVLGYDGIPYALSVARRHVEKGIGALGAFPPGPARETMEAIAYFTIERTM